MHATAALALLPFALAATVRKRVGGPAPVLRPRGEGVLDGKYIVRLRSDSSESDVADAISLFQGDASHVYRSDEFRGFAAALDAAGLAAVTNHPSVEYVENDVIVRAQSYVTQPDAPWGLARISHRARGATSYTYDNSAGAGTCVYVVDSGIYTDHEEFQGRATWLANFIDDNNVDADGHGTHIAALIGGVTYGAAKKTQLYSVKMLAGDYSTGAAATAALDFVLTDSKTRSCPNGILANLSWRSAAYTDSINNSTANLINAGIFVTTSGGGVYPMPFGSPWTADLCWVGAIDDQDAWNTYGGYGSIMSIFAPGDNVTSAWIGSTTATSAQSGTSFATGLVTGVAAYLLTLLGPKTPGDLCNYLSSTSTVGVMTGAAFGGTGSFPIFDSQNRLLFNGNPSG
ncbi:serine protease [Thozetella sp. PMI_491]|nr:serine protease [Thozetella sp. PMI_491]